MDLGANWSNTLQLREKHQLVTHGVYRTVRHPTYTAMLIHCLGRALVLPNWVAGPSALGAFALLVALRLRSEDVTPNAFRKLTPDGGEVTVPVQSLAHSPSLLQPDPDVFIDDGGWTQRPRRKANHAESATA